ncbi:hypothetical protein HUW63_18815 [Myxococcus sp. AM001]|uniref:hypothetical protein n=1 Tax=Myxococcus vastator TaxID=2709664 RepID=UPI0013D2390C|nr:hypothetical protein [Myxococcus vastator]NVJ07285.1 hypothetical protein [Myxococcus sp. AM001]
MQLKSLMGSCVLAVAVLLAGCGGTELETAVSEDLGVQESAISLCQPGAPSGSLCGNGGTCVYEYRNQTAAPCRPKCSTSGTCSGSQVCCPGPNLPYCMPAYPGCLPLIPLPEP